MTSLAPKVVAVVRASELFTIDTDLREGMRHTERQSSRPILRTIRSRRRHKPQSEPHKFQRGKQQAPGGGSKDNQAPNCIHRGCIMVVTERANASKFPLLMRITLKPYESHYAQATHGRVR